MAKLILESLDTGVDTGPRSISSIAIEISKDWKKVYFGAVPYLRAMHSINSIDDSYGYDTVSSIVAYFLCNAQTWKGDVARRVKKELNAMLKKVRGT